MEVRAGHQPPVTGASYEQDDLQLGRAVGQRGFARWRRRVLPGVWVAGLAATRAGTRRSSCAAPTRQLASLATCACGRGARIQGGSHRLTTSRSTSGRGQSVAVPRGQRRRLDSRPVARAATARWPAGRRSRPLPLRANGVERRAFVQTLRSRSLTGLIPPAIVIRSVATRGSWLWGQMPVIRSAHAPKASRLGSRPPDGAYDIAGQVRGAGLSVASRSNACRRRSNVKMGNLRVAGRAYDRGYAPALRLVHRYLSSKGSIYPAASSRVTGP